MEYRIKDNQFTTISVQSLALEITKFWSNRDHELQFFLIPKVCVECRIKETFNDNLNITFSFFFNFITLEHQSQTLSFQASSDNWRNLQLSNRFIWMKLFALGSSLGILRIRLLQEICSSRRELSCFCLLYTSVTTLRYTK